MEKRSVRLRKIMIDAVRFWFLLVIFAGLGAFAGYRSTISYNKGIDDTIKAEEELKRKQAEAEAELAKDKTEDVVFTRKECEKKLSENAKREVLETYTYYQDRISRRKQMDESLLWKLDPFDFNSVYLQFRVVHENETESITAFNSYVHALKLYVNYNDLVEELVAKYNLDTTPRLLADMISISDGGKNDYDDFLMITIYQDELTSQLNDKVAETFCAYGDKLAQTYPGFHVELANVSKANYYNPSLISSLDTQKSTIVSDQTKIDTALKKFSSMQKAYYNMLVNGTDEETITELVEAGTVTKKKAVVEEDDTPAKRKILPMMILGAAAGIVAAFALILLGNLLSGKLLSDRDFQGIYGVRSLGMIRERKKKGIPGMLQTAEYPEAEDSDKLVYLPFNLKAMIEKQDLKEITIVSTGSLDNISGLEALSDNIRKENIEIHTISEFPQNVEAAENLLKSRTVVLMEEFHKAKLKKIDRVVGFCKDNEISVLGAVGIVR